MSSWEVNLLGPWDVRVDGTRVTHWRGQRVQALLAYLAVESDRPHARPRLGGLLWPDLDGGTATRNLTQALGRLRQAFGVHPGDPQDPLNVTRHTLQWRAEAGQVDVLELRRLAASSDETDLERMSLLYRGDFLAGFSLPDSDEFGEWLGATREHLRELALGRLQGLATRQLADGHPAAAGATAARQIELDPLREGAHRQLMEALAAGGDRDGALAAYARCREALWHGLHAEPDAETRALADRIESGEAGRGGAAPRSAAAALASPPHHLPAPLAQLVGREAELARIADLFGAGERLVTIVGAGGTGKTSLALAAAWAVEEAAPQTARWVPLDGLPGGGDGEDERAALTRAVAGALGVRLSGGPAPLEELGTALRDRALLLILDNCEHLAAVTGVAGSLLQAAPGVRILATSRGAIGLRGEVLVPLEGLAVPAGPVADPARYAAVQLLLLRAPQLLPDWARDPEELEGAAELCRLLDGLPLAIEIASQWVGHYPPREIAADLDLLTSGLRDVPERHRSMRAAFDYSLGLLSTGDAVRLARLSVFRGGFDRPGALAVAGLEAATLEALVDTALVQPAGPGRFRLHELLRQFAAERLSAPGESEATGERHTAHYVGLAEKAAPGLLGPEQATWMERLERDRDNLRAVLVRAREQGRTEVVLRLGGALARYWHFTGLLREGRDWLEGGLAQADAASVPAPARALACLGAGQLANLEGSPEQAARWLEEAVLLYEEIADPAGSVRALTSLGSVAYSRGDLERAAELWEESLSLARAAGAGSEAALVLGNLGVLAYAQGDLEGATGRYREALALAPQAGRADVAANMLWGLGNIAWRQGDLAGAAGLLRRALTALQRLGNRRDIVLFLGDLAESALVSGRTERAVRLLGAAREQRLETGLAYAAPERTALDRLLTKAQARLGPAAYATAFERGRTEPLTEAVAGAFAP